MKILAVSDLHFGLNQFDWVAQQAPCYDLVIIAGDLLDIAGHVDLDAQITVIVKCLRTISSQTRLLVCSGNHDGDEKNEAQEYIARWLQRVRAAGLVVDGASLEFGEVKLSVCHWWDGPASREAMNALLRAEQPAASKTWLWVHHAPPAGVGVSWTGKENAGDASLVNLISELRPGFVFSGHIHNSPFRAGGAGSSMPDGNSGLLRPTLNSTLMPGPPAGFRRPAPRKSGSTPGPDRPPPKPDSSCSSLMPANGCSMCWAAVPAHVATPAHPSSAIREDRPEG